MENNDKNTEVSQSCKNAVSDRSCISCKHCYVLANAKMQTSFACVKRVWEEIIPNISELKGKTCDKYVAE